ncbi:MAG: hypothetical protein JSS31_04815 [Proteobacteria bacterium]|nr:hypothetical protein [Pseudomonadota bacterium]MBS0493271.1 hypothetical protein [Pseudomonadota bacterium]
MSKQASSSNTTVNGSIRVCVFDSPSKAPLENATVSLWSLTEDQAETQKNGQSTYRPEENNFVISDVTGYDGRVQFDNLKPMHYLVVLHHLQPLDGAKPHCVKVLPGSMHDACFDLKLNVQESQKFALDDCRPTGCPREGDIYESTIEIPNFKQLAGQVALEPPLNTHLVQGDPLAYRGVIGRAGPQVHHWKLLFIYQQVFDGAPSTGARAALGGATSFDANARTPQPVSGNLGVALSRTSTASTADLSFWQGILNSTEQMSFNNYLRFMNMLFCGENDPPPDLPLFEQQRFREKRAFGQNLKSKRLLPFTDSDAYRAVKAATEAFVMINCGVLARTQPFDDTRDNAYLQRRDLPLPAGGSPAQVFNNEYLVSFLGSGEADRTLPYLAVIRSKLPDISIKLNSLDIDPDQVGQCTGILQDKLTNPCLLELIWSYWHEEGMLVQTMNAITRRFQNVRSSQRDPLVNLEIDPLRPLNNVLWGFVQDEQHRLSVVRRNYEYDHHYGLRLEGRAVQRMLSADSRSRFIEAFHNLLRMAAVFFKQDDDTTVKADAFPVLNALKEVHLILSQGAHNQFGDLPSTARIEMLMEQWLLARPEFREFLPTRLMTAYPEPWMDRVDAMKKLQGWSDASVLHFRNLAIFGEQILLSIRWGHWSDVQEPLQAFNWLRFFRPQIQGYSHAYRAVTGVDLSIETTDTKVDATLPSVLLQRRLALQARTA